MLAVSITKGFSGADGFPVLGGGGGRGYHPCRGSYPETFPSSMVGSLSCVPAEGSVSLLVLGPSCISLLGLFPPPGLQALPCPFLSFVNFWVSAQTPLLRLAPPPGWRYHGMRAQLSGDIGELLPHPLSLLGFSRKLGFQGGG